ncbi:2-oxoacid:acceptor oxidoreductase subunit alpha [Candidatus Woesearchaeota archaeon]|nr:2-oxoacid:acceptor oxidoreductase subunit alpha [Candidatus Woesearchaeota archaeon]
MPLPDGTSYNSYLIKGSEKTILIDTCEFDFKEELLDNIKSLGVDKIDYVISNHAEQDHSGSLNFILGNFPNAKVVCNEKAKKVLQNEFEFSDDVFLIISDGETLSLGDKTLEFIFAEWVHWPETMFTYLREDKILFPCDFFGAHLANNDFVTGFDEISHPAKRYYAEIMMPFSSFVKKHLLKLENYSINVIAPSHGPIYSEPEMIINLYKEWTSEKYSNVVVMPYITMHGDVPKMISYLAEKLKSKDFDVKLYDLSDSDVGDIAMNLINSYALVCGSPSYLGGMHPKLASLLYLIKGFKPTFKYTALINSFYWGSGIVEEFKTATAGLNAKYIDSVLIQGKLNDDGKKLLDVLAEKLMDEEKMDTVNVSNFVDYKNNIQKKLELKDDVSIVLCGEAGQGIQTIQQMLTHLLRLDGYNVFTTKEYMSRVRGGSNSTEIRVTSKKSRGFVNKIDILIPLDEKAVEHLQSRISEDTIIIGNRDIVPEKYSLIDIPFVKIATQIGNKIYANTISVATILSLFNVSSVNLENYLRTRFDKKGEDVINNNLLAAKKGFELGKKIILDGISINVAKSDDSRNDIFLCGTDAVGLGAIAGGCNFVSSYPMSPSTGVLVFLSGQSNDFKINVEQAEDEICAVNMGLGASYSGARSLVTTSGGGFALMGEGVSLSGMIETPIVFHIAQRPGPATGLPTRTGQEDLNLVLYAGHGEFPRMIFAPGTLDDGYFLTAHAFNMADKYQIPAFVLTDEYYVDTYYNCEKFDVNKIKAQKNIVETDVDYKRYSYSETGISPRGVPGNGTGLVCADSDEHDETGHVTEDSNVRIKMQQKRLKKGDVMMQDVLLPKIVGNNDDYDVAIISWGSTFETVKEAVEKINEEGKQVCLFHFVQLYPLYSKINDIFEKATKTIIIEGNSTSQFSRLIRQETGFLIPEKILKYDGFQFTVEEVYSEILKRI